MGRSYSPSVSKRQKERSERKKRRERRSREREVERKSTRKTTRDTEREERKRSRSRSRGGEERLRRRSTRTRSLSRELRDQPSASTSSSTSYHHHHHRSSKPTHRTDFSEADFAGKSPEEIELMKTMGFSNFDTTKNKKVDGNDVGEVHVILKRKYRQYMNRKGGFNRPLDFVA